MKHQELVYNLTGQSWYYDPPEGRPDASPTPTVRVILNLADDDTAEVQAATTGTVSIDSVNTTTSVALAAGADTITLTSGTGVTKGMRYVLGAALTSTSEMVEVVSVSGSTAKVRRPLVNGYSAGAIFQGTRMTIGVDSTWIATKSKITDILATTWRTDSEASSAWGAGYAGYRLRWTYSVNGTPCLGVSYADVARYVSKNLVTPSDVDQRFPGWIDLLPTDYRADQGAALVAEAFQAVKVDLMVDNQTLRRVRNTEVIRELVIYRANLIATEARVLMGAASNSARELAQALYQGRYDQLVREPKIQVDQIGGGAAAAPNRATAWRR